MRRALAIDEKAYGPDHPTVATRLNTLATLLQDTNRLAEAEPLVRRALAIDEKAYGPDHPNVALRLNNLAQLLQDANRLTESEPLMRRVLAIDEKAYGPDHPAVARDLNNLAQLFQATNRLAEAESPMRRALAIDEKAYGPDHPTVAMRLNNLAGLLADTNRLTEAEPLMRRALAIDEKAYGPDHPKVATRLNNLSFLREEQSDWTGAAALCLRAKPAMTGARTSTERESRTLTKAVLAQNTAGLRNCARAHYRANSSANLGEGFALTQWALQNSAVDALNSMSVRFAKGDAWLAQTVREEQDLLTARTAACQWLDAAAGESDAKATEVASAVIAEIEAQLAHLIHLRRGQVLVDMAQGIELA